MAKPFSGLARRGLAQVGHLPPQEKLAQLKALGARFYVCGGSLEPFKVSKTELLYDDIIVAEYFTLLEVMRTADTKIVLQ